ncbi:MAG: histidine phosphatase family protein [Fibrobacteres bacterium]|nr:histidine phosphatase family protein [Fibrobacterota bacterium]
MNQSLELWLVRHGESTYNAEGRYAGWSDPPLTEAGTAMAAALAPRLADNVFEGIWRSDKVRTEHTARLAGFPDANVDIRLREVDFGQMEGKTYFEVGEELRHQLRSFADFQAPGGESTAQVRSRVHDFLAGLPSGKHLVFCHGGWIRCVLAECGTDRFPDKAEICRVKWPERVLLEDPA